MHTGLLIMCALGRQRKQPCGLFLCPPAPGTGLPHGPIQQDECPKTPKPLLKGRDGPGGAAQPAGP